MVNEPDDANIGETFPDDPTYTDTPAFTETNFDTQERNHLRSPNSGYDISYPAKATLFSRYKSIDEYYSQSNQIFLYAPEVSLDMDMKNADGAATYEVGEKVFLGTAGWDCMHITVNDAAISATTDTEVDLSDNIEYLSVGDLVILQRQTSTFQSCLRRITDVSPGTTETITLNQRIGFTADAGDVRIYKVYGVPEKLKVFMGDGSVREITKFYTLTENFTSGSTISTYLTEDLEVNDWICFMHGLQPLIAKITAVSPGSYTIDKQSTWTDADLNTLRLTAGTPFYKLDSYIYGTASTYTPATVCETKNKIKSLVRRSDSTFTIATKTPVAKIKPSEKIQEADEDITFYAFESIFYSNDHYIGDGTRKAFFYRNYNSGSGTITNVENGGFGVPRFVCNSNHQLKTGEYVTISGTTSYNGTFAIASVPSCHKFTIAQVYVGDESGSWEGPALPDPGVNNRNWDDSADLVYKTYSWPFSGSITAIADIEEVGGGNYVEVTTANNHYLYEGDTIEITNSTNYDGTYTVFAVTNVRKFVIAHSDDGTDTGTLGVTVGTKVVALTVYDGAAHGNLATPVTTTINTYETVKYGFGIIIDLDDLSEGYLTEQLSGGRHVETMRSLDGTVKGESEVERLKNLSITSRASIVSSTHPISAVNTWRTAQGLTDLPDDLVTFMYLEQNRAIATLTIESNVYYMLLSEGPRDREAGMLEQRNIQATFRVLGQ